MATLIKIDRNGSKHYEDIVTCGRCQGRGWYAVGVNSHGELIASGYDQGVCWECHGTGKVRIKWIERTPEYQAKLDARRAAKAEAKAAQYRKEYEEKMRKEAEEQAAKEAEEARIKAISQYQGEVGQKITVDIVEYHSAMFETHFGYRTQTNYIHIMKDANGNVYTWKTQNSMCYEILGKDGWHWIPIDEAEAFTIKGTVKDHSEYKGEKQTVLTRCKVSRKDETK